MQLESLGLGAWALSLLERISVGLISLADDRRVVFANTEAVRILARGDTLTLKDSRLVAADGYARQLDRLIGARHSGGPFCSVLSDRDDGKLVLLLDNDGPGEALGGGMTLWLMDGQTGVSRADWMSGAFGLTPAEQRVVEQLANGQSTEEASAALGVSIATIRTHLQRTYAKTGARNQSGLVRLALLKSVN